MRVLSLVLARWPWFALLASAGMLATAWSFQIFGHLPPCHLCLKQREAYWIAGSIALAGVVLDLTPLRSRTGRIVCALLVLAFLYSFAWAGYHAGVEQKWWPGPKGCTGGGAVTAGDIVAMLKSSKLAVPQCDQIPWSMLGLSMAGWNTLVSVGLVALSAAAALRRPAP